MKGILLSQGKVALVDDEDYASVAGMRWQAVNIKGSIYACTRMNSKMQYLHRVIMQPTDRQLVDHKDGNGLNNLRSNLRICTDRQNARNSISRRNKSSHFKGVSKTTNGYWKVQICVDGFARRLGTFQNDINAARVYDVTAQHYFGEFAYLNLPLAELPGC